MGRGRPTPGFLTKQGAQHELDAILADTRRGQLIAPVRTAGGVTFAEAAAEWLRYIDHDRKRRPTTVRDYRIVVGGVLNPVFGDAPIEAITSGHFDTFRARLVGQGRLSGRTINKSTWPSSTASSSAHSVSTGCLRTPPLASSASRAGDPMTSTSCPPMRSRGSCARRRRHRIGHLHDGRLRQTSPRRAVGAQVARRRLREAADPRASLIRHARGGRAEVGPRSQRSPR
jgi:hypothetical protein